MGTSSCGWNESTYNDKFMKLDFVQIRFEVHSTL